MSPQDDIRSSEFERRSAALLRHSVDRLDGRTRSRLNQARQRALEELSARERAPWRRWLDLRTFAPAGAVAAAALLAVVLWSGRGDPLAPAPVALTESAAALEDLDLLADSDALELTADADGDYEFYEWAGGEIEAVGS